MKNTAASILALLIAASQSPAWGHSRLKSLTAIRSRDTLRVSVRFSTPIEVPFSRFTLFPKGSGNPVPLFPPEGARQTSHLVLTASGFTPGAYVFSYTILSADGHRQEDSRDLILE